jgi:tRNA G18 (ribose-2'-O)-methylase SpoU
VGADENGNVPLASHDFTAPTVLIFGNETRGLGRSYKELCDTLVRIPMVGSATSLNLAVAASIVLYEVGRQRSASTA